MLFRVNGQYHVGLCAYGPCGWGRVAIDIARRDLRRFIRRYGPVKSPAFRQLWWVAV